MKLVSELGLEVRSRAAKSFNGAQVGIFEPWMVNELVYSDRTRLTVVMWYFGTHSKNTSMFHFGSMTIIECLRKLKKLVR